MLNKGVSRSKCFGYWKDRSKATKKFYFNLRPFRWHVKRTPHKQNGITNTGHKSQ